jgi:DNA-binding NtrC family response regulator
MGEAGALAGERSPPRAGAGYPGVVGEAPAFLEMLGELDRILDSGARVLVLEGETGTGKTLIARAIHDRRGASELPLLFFPTAALPSALLEGQLFGARGGPPGLLALADGGTLVLEDADALPPELQDGLAELFEPGGGDELPLMIFTTRKTLSEVLGNVPFLSPLSDLLQRYRVVVPPLRRRNGDVELLALHFLRELARRRGEATGEPEPAALRALERQPWPGNVRELRTTLEAAVDLAPGAGLRLENLRIRIRTTRPVAGSEGESETIELPPEGKTLEEIESEAVRAILGLTRWNRSQAARILGISRPTLARKIRKYDLNGGS